MGKIDNNSQNWLSFMSQKLFELLINEPVYLQYIGGSDPCARSSIQKLEVSG